MSVVCVLSPVVVAGWPAFQSAVVAASASLGFLAASQVDGARRKTAVLAAAGTRVELEIPNSEVVTGSLGRDERIAVTREGVTVVFSRDPRGRTKLCVEGAGEFSHLRDVGEELSRAVVRTYVHQRIKDEMAKRNFNIVEEATETDGSIRLRVRHWE